MIPILYHPGTTALLVGIDLARAKLTQALAYPPMPNIMDALAVKLRNLFPARRKYRRRGGKQKSMSDCTMTTEDLRTVSMLGGEGEENKLRV